MKRVRYKGFYPSSEKESITYREYYRELQIGDIVQVDEIISSEYDADENKFFELFTGKAQLGRVICSEFDSKKNNFKELVQQGEKGVYSMKYFEVVE